MSKTAQAAGRSPEGATEGPAVLRGRAPAAPMAGDHLDAVPFAQQAIEWVTVVRLVSDETVGDFVDEAFVERLLDEADFVGTSAFNPHCERKTVAVRNCHDLGPFSALRLTNAKTPLFAPLKEASMKPSLKSSFPFSRRC